MSRARARGLERALERALDRFDRWTRPRRNETRRNRSIDRSIDRARRASTSARRTPEVSHRRRSSRARRADAVVEKRKTNTYLDRLTNVYTTGRNACTTGTKRKNTSARDEYVVKRDLTPSRFTRRCPSDRIEFDSMERARASRHRASRRPRDRPRTTSARASSPRGVGDARPREIRDARVVRASFIRFIPIRHRSDSCRSTLARRAVSIRTTKASSSWASVRFCNECSEDRRG